MSEDLPTRFIAYGWNVLRVGDANDVEAGFGTGMSNSWQNDPVKVAKAGICSRFSAFLKSQGASAASGSLFRVYRSHGELGRMLKAFALDLLEALTRAFLSFRRERGTQAQALLR